MQVFMWIGYAVGWVKGLLGIKSAKTNERIAAMWPRDKDGNVILTPPPAGWKPPWETRN